MSVSYTGWRWSHGSHISCKVLHVAERLILLMLCLLLLNSLHSPGERFPNSYGQHFPGISPLNYMPPPSGSAKPTFSPLWLRENEKGKCVLSPFINNQKHTTQVTLSEHPIPPFHISDIPNNLPPTAHSNQDGTCALHRSSVPIPAQRVTKQKATEIEWLVFISIHMGHWS